MTDLERKLQLTRFLREESAINRMKMRNREEILYGNPKAVLGKEELPLVYDGPLERDGYPPSSGGSLRRSLFGVRLALALVLFGAVVYLDKTGTMLGDEPAAQVIARQVTVSSEDRILEFFGQFSGSEGGSRTGDDALRGDGL